MRNGLRDKAWRDFVAWCQGRGLQPIPAHPWTVAAYARWCTPRHPHRVIVKRLKTVARAHLLAGYQAPDRHPMVMRTLHAIETGRHVRRRGPGLFRAEDFAGAAETPSTKAPPDAPPDTPLVPAGHRQLRGTPRLVPRRPKGS